MRAGRPISVAVTALAAVAFLASTAPAASAAKSPCGLTKRTCTFADNFNGDSLNRNKWQVMTTATMGLTTGGECYVDDPANIGVANGYLTLTATKSSSAQPCGWFSTPYRSGMIFTGDRFAQTYGRFEVRARFPKGSGFASGFWLWPLQEAYGGASGEIDVAEHFGAYPDLVSPHIHILNGGERGDGAYCNVTDPSGRFHTYAVEWQPLGGFKFLYDGVTCMTMSSWDPGAPLSFPQPFDKPFFVLLTLALGYNENAVSSSSPFPAKFVIDYVRAWK